MKEGIELADALKYAIQLKGVRKSELARVFGIRPQSVADWVNFGRVSKKYIEGIVSYFCDVVPPEHWGIDSDKISGMKQEERDALEALRTLPPEVKSEFIDQIKKATRRIMGFKDDDNDDNSGGMRQPIQDQKPVRQKKAAGGGMRYALPSPNETRHNVIMKMTTAVKEVIDIKGLKENFYVIMYIMSNENDLKNSNIIKFPLQTISANDHKIDRVA